MDERTQRGLSVGSSMAALLTALGLVIAACGGTANESGGGAAGEEPAGGTTTARGGEETTGGGTAVVDREALAQVPGFPQAPRDDENPRFRGSQEMSLEEFVGYVVDDSNAKWQGVLESVDLAYSPADYVPFEEPVTVPEGCGSDETGTVADPAAGPYYCPLDLTVYWPPDWVNPASGKSLAEYGDFAMAAAAAHEVGHHVQEQLGILEAERSGEYTSLQIELQADCFAGVWGFSTYYEGLVESGDLDEAVGLFPDLADLPEQPRGGAGAHGTPEERVKAFLLGYDYGDPVRCLDTFTPLPEQTTGG